MYTQFFGNYLLANGYVTRDQLFSAMCQEADQHMKLGTLALHAGYMNAATRPTRTIVSVSWRFSSDT